VQSRLGLENKKKDLTKPKSQIPHIYFKIGGKNFIESVCVYNLEIIFFSRVLSIFKILYVSGLQLSKVFGAALLSW
jgi:hypothetical protein